VMAAPIKYDGAHPHSHTGRNLRPRPQKLYTDLGPRIRKLEDKLRARPFYTPLLSGRCGLSGTAVHKTSKKTHPGRRVSSHIHKVLTRVTLLMV